MIGGLCWPLALGGAAFLAVSNNPLRRCPRLPAVLNQRSGRRRRIPRITLMCTAFGVACVLVTLVGTGYAAAAAGIGLGAGGIHINRSRRRVLLGNERAGWIAALEAVAAELRAGAHPATAYAAGAEGSSGLARRVLTITAARTRLGGAPWVALRQLAGDREYSLLAEHIGCFAALWRVAESSGLAPADLLAVQRAELVAGQAFERQLEGDLAAPRTTAAVLTTLPAIGIGLGELIGAQPLSVIMHTSIGGVLLVVGVTLAGLGRLWADALMDSART